MHFFTGYRLFHSTRHYMIIQFRASCIYSVPIINSEKLRLQTRYKPMTDFFDYPRCNFSTSNIIMKKLAHINKNYVDDWTTHEEYQYNTLYFSLGTTILFLGLAFLVVPLYRIFCETTSFEGIAQVAKNMEKIAKMKKMKNRLVKITFSAESFSNMAWNFRPAQKEIYVYPGETALAFYTAKNPTDEPVIGISSYNINPFQAAYYFNKIQCFCFEDQLLNPGEEVDLPVFFYIDPDFANDPYLENMQELDLSYIFFESKEGLELLSPFKQNVNVKT